MAPFARDFLFPAPSVGFTTCFGTCKAGCEFHLTRVTLADADFGQPYLTNFGLNLGGRLWQSRLWPKLVFQSLGLLFKKKNENNKMRKKHRRSTTSGPRRVGPRRVGLPSPEKWSPEGWGPNFAFFPSPATVFILFVSVWVSSRGILVVFEAPGLEMCTFWSSRVVV